MAPTNDTAQNTFMESSFPSHLHKKDFFLRE
jgi:hypothetical protein